MRQLFTKDIQSQLEEHYNFKSKYGDNPIETI